MFEESASAIPSLWASMNSWFTPTVLFVLLNLVIGTIAFTSFLTNQKQHPQNQNNDSQNHQYQHHQQHYQQRIIRQPSVLQRLKSINFYSYYRSQEPAPVQSFAAQVVKPDTYSDSDIAFNSQPQTLQIQAQYFSQQENFEENLVKEQHHHETPANYLFEKAHEQNLHETQKHMIFEKTHGQNLQETQTHMVFEQNNEVDFHNVHEHEEHEDELKSMDEVYSQLTNSVHFNRTKSDTEPTSGEVPAKLPAKMKKSASLKSPFQHFEEEDIVEKRRPATVKEKSSGATKAAADEDGVDAKADDFINRFKHQLKLQRIDSIIRYKEMIRGSGK